MSNNRPERFTNLIHARVPQDGSRTVTDYRFFYDDPRRYGLTVDPSGIGVPTPAEIAAGVTPVNYAYRVYDVKRFGALDDDNTDATSAIQTALGVAAQNASGSRAIVRAYGAYRIAGTLTIPPGVTLDLGVGAAEYYPSSPYSTSQGGLLHKHSTDTAGPIVVLQSGSCVKNGYLLHEKSGGATSGIVQIGIQAASTNDSTYNSRISNVQIYGVLTADVTGTSTTCYGVYFTDGSVTGTVVQRYFNGGNDVRVTNCDVAFRLGKNCNANHYTGVTTRQCYWHFDLDGGASNQQCVENVFSSIVCANIGALPTTPSVVFVLRNYALFNVFSGYTTECNGSAFSIDSTCLDNQFYGTENELSSSIVPTGNIHGRWARPVNVDQQIQMLLPNLTTGSKYTNGQGNHIWINGVVSGTLPQLSGAGALVAANVNCKRIATFDSSVYAKSQRPCFFFKLRVALNAPGGGVGEGMVSVEGFYRVTDNSTNAASFSVLRVDSKPAANYIAGLFFLTGVAAGSGFGLAITGGNVGAVTATHVLVDLEIIPFTHDTNSVAMASYANITFASAAATANDITDAISLLTVADTAI